MSTEKKTGCLGSIGDYTTQYMGIFISQCKDPYKPTSIMESRRVFFVAHTWRETSEVYYWSTNQVIVQRALAARSLADGQKGVLFAASMFLGFCLYRKVDGIDGRLEDEKNIASVFFEWFY